MVEIVAPTIAGAVLSDGSLLTAKQKVDGGPSVLFDAVAVIASAEGAALLAGDAAARDFVTDAFAHCKFISFSAEAMVLFERAGISDELDDGCMQLAKPADAKPFVDACGQLRFWNREVAVDATS